MPMQHHDLQCEVLRLAYDYDAKAGELHMEEDNCCHAPACVELFERIDPDVKIIRTFAGAVPDTIYARDRSGKWAARMPPAA